MTPARRQALLGALRQGASREAAAAVAGIDRTTLWRWTQDDADFAAEVERADAEAEIVMTTTLYDAAAKDWRAAAFWLERRRPSTFGRRAVTDFDVRVAAERLAADHGLDVDELLRRSEGIVATYTRRYGRWPGS